VNFDFDPSLFAVGRGSSVGVTTVWTAGAIPDRDEEFFSISQRPDRVWGLSSLLSNGYRGISPWIKRPKHEAGQLPPSSAEVKNGGDIPPLPIRLHGLVLI
jgi:hypothetical protein